jgi:hypothetical protein
MGSAQRHREPAPIQVTAWGNATGTGLPTIDYLFSDPVSIPEQVRCLFAEQISDLPCAIIVEPPPEDSSRASRSYRQVLQPGRIYEGRGRGLSDDVGEILRRPDDGLVDLYPFAILRRKRWARRQSNWT